MHFTSFRGLLRASIDYVFFVGKLARRDTLDVSDQSQRLERFARLFVVSIMSIVVESREINAGKRKHQRIHDSNTPFDSIS